MQTLAFLYKTFIIGICLSWKYGKIYNIKCLFLSQMLTISEIHVTYIHEFKNVMAIKLPSLWAFQLVQISQLSTMTNWIFFVTPLHNKRRATVSRDKHWTRNRWQQPRTSTRNNVIHSVDASKIYFVAPLLTQYWLACKLTCTKRNFDTHQSVTDITAAIGTPCLHKLWLGLVLTTGRSSITTFVFTWTGDCVCGHLLSSNETLDLRWNCNVVVTTMLYLLHMTCFELRT